MGSRMSNVSSSGKLRLSTDYADAQAVLSLRCPHVPTKDSSQIVEHFFLA